MSAPRRAGTRLCRMRFCASDELPEGQLRSRKLAGVPVAVARYDGYVYAFGALCPHQHADLSRGILDERGVACPQHLWHFELATGRCTSVPGAAVPTYRVEERDGAIVVEVPVRSDDATDADAAAPRGACDDHDACDRADADTDADRGHGERPAP